MTIFFRIAAVHLVCTACLQQGIRGDDACTTVSLAVSAAAASGRSILKIPPSQIAACYDLFPFSPDVQKATLNVLGRVLDVYAFTDYLKSSPNPLFQPSLEQDFLASLGNARYVTDRQFHETVQDVLSTARDGHLSYSVQCYATFSYLQPVYLTSSIVQGQAALFIHSYAEDESSKDLSELIGAKVIKIDGVPAIAAVQSYADTQGFSKDENTRFTRMLASKTWDAGSFKVIRGAFATRKRPPTSDVVTYVLELANKQVKTVEIPWLVKAYKRANWNDARSYWSAVCLPPVAAPTATAAAVSIKSLPFVDVKSSRKVRGHLKNEKTRESTATAAATAPVGDPVPFATGTGYAFFTLAKASKVGVFKLTSFPYQGLEVWFEGIRGGFKKLKRMNVDAVIVDLADNVGGSLCAALGMLRVVSAVASLASEFRPFLTDIRLGADWAQQMTLALKASPSSAFSGATYLNVDTGRPFKPDEWTHFASKRSGGKLYTPLFTDNCESVQRMVASKFAGEEAGWEAHRVALVTNGVCLSSCSLLHHAVHEASAIPTVAVYAPSGTRNRLVSPSSATGGMAYSVAALMGDLAEAGMDAAALPLSADLSFTLRQAYSRLEPEMPLEYRRVIADYELPYDLQNVLDPARLWKDVALKVWGAS